MRTKLVDDTTIEVNITEDARCHSKNEVELPCSARSDDSTPVSIRWFKLAKYGEMSAVVVTDKLKVLDNGSMIRQIPGDDCEGWTHYKGTYKCQASNGYSVDTRLAIITVACKVPDPGIRLLHNVMQFVRLRNKIFFHCGP